MIVLSDNRKFSLSYHELREAFLEIASLSDQDFMKQIPKVLHVASIISFLKETPTYLLHGDTGLIHELIHLLPGQSTTTPLSEIRKQFDELARLA